MRFLQKDAREFVMVVLRFAAASVLLWFGVDKWIHPEAWYGWMPSWLWTILPDGTIDWFLFLNGTFEFVLGCLLAAGVLLRVASAAAFLFVLAVTLTIGANEISVRDMSLMGIYLALFLHADAESRKRVPQQVIATVVGLYVLMLFVYGVLYLRSAPTLG